MGRLKTATLKDGTTLSKLQTKVINSGDGVDVVAVYDFPENDTKALRELLEASGIPINLGKSGRSRYGVWSEGDKLVFKTASGYFAQKGNIILREEPVRQQEPEPIKITPQEAKTYRTEEEVNLRIREIQKTVPTDQAKKEVNQLKAIRQNIREAGMREELETLSAVSPATHWTSKLSFSDPIGMRSLFAIGYGALRGQTEDEMKKSVLEIQKEYVRDLKQANKDMPGGAFAKQVVEGALILAPVAMASVPVTGLRSAVTSLAGRGTIRAFQGYQIGQTIKNPNAENVFFAVAPIMGEAGIYTFNKIPKIQQRAIIKEATTIRTKIRLPYGKVRTITEKLPAKEVTKLQEMLNKAGDYIKTKPVVRDINLHEVKNIPSKAVPVIESFLKKRKMIVGGSVAQKAQMNSMTRIPGDLDVYGKFPSARIPELIQMLKDEGIRVGKSKSGDITINGKKAIQIHDIRMFQQNVEKLTPFLRTYKSHITETPEGIKIMKLTTQMRRKLIGSFEDNKYRFSKDYPDFETIMGEMERIKEGQREIVRTAERTTTRRPKFQEKTGEIERIAREETGKTGEKRGISEKEYKQRSYNYNIKPKGYPGRAYYNKKPTAGYNPPTIKRDGTGYKPEPEKVRKIPSSYPPGKPNGYWGKGGTSAVPPGGGKPTVYKEATKAYQQSKKASPSLSKPDEKKYKKRNLGLNQPWQLVQDPYLRLLGRAKRSRKMNLLKAQKEGNVHV